MTDLIYKNVKVCHKITMQTMKFVFGTEKLITNLEMLCKSFEGQNLKEKNCKEVVNFSSHTCFYFCRIKRFAPKGGWQTPVCVHYAHMYVLFKTILVSLNL